MAKCKVLTGSAVKGLISCLYVVVTRQRLKNRRSILSQGDERWKDVVQELEKELGSVNFSL